MKRISKEEAVFNALAKLPRIRTKRKDSRKVWVKKADSAFGAFIRARAMGKCFVCGKWATKLDCSHIIPRQYKILRWDDKNAEAMCYFCHMVYWHGSPAESGAWYRENFAEDWEYLQKKKLEKWSPTVEELKAICEKYINLTERL